jgi:hypothetical protein
MARELFIYWKVAAEQASQALAAAHRLQAALRTRHPGLETRLYRRLEIQDGRGTIMETYSRAAGVDESLQSAIEAAASLHLRPWQTTARHVEVFERSDD